MEGALMLLMFSAFLAILVFRMDQNEKKSKKEDDYKKAFMEGYTQGLKNEDEHKS